MDLITPQFDLILWAIVRSLYLAVELMAITSIVKINFKDSTPKLVRLLEVLLVLLAGPILYLPLAGIKG